MNAFNRFFRDWTADAVRHGDELWYDSSYHPAIWTDVYQQVQHLFTEVEFGDLRLETKDSKRCFRTSGLTRKGKGNLLEERPYLYVRAVAHPTSPIVIKILFSAHGIEMGLDFVEKDKQAKAAGLREAYHAFLSMPELLQGFRFFNDRQDCGGLQAAKQAYAADGRLKINPLLEIPKNEGWHETQYLDAMREALRKNRLLLLTVLPQVRTSSGAELFYSVTFQELLPYKDQWDKLHSCIKLCGGEYKGVPLMFQEWDHETRKPKKEKACRDLSEMSAGVAAALIRQHGENDDFWNKHVIQKAQASNVHPMGIADRFVHSLKGTGIENFMKRTAAAFKYYEDAKPEDLRFFYNQGTNTTKLQHLEQEAPDLHHLLFHRDKQPYVFPDMQTEQVTRAETTTGSTELPNIARQCIYAGAPGTGKSHNMKKLAEEIFKDNIRRVTFHPEYAYYDFVGTYRPTMDKESKERKIVYKFAPGPFAKTLKDALNHPKTPYCLLIEEINRARVAAVFGDIFQLLDRFSANDSAPAVPFESEYPVDAPEELWDYLTDEGSNKEVLRLLEKKNGMIYLPDNLYIYASMNSADQGVFPMDTAFKRRWSFEYTPLNPSAAEKKDIMAKIRAREGVSETTAECWDAIRRGINALLKELHVNEDKMMGFFFLKEEERKDAEHLQRALEGKVLMYLFEDVAQVCHGSMFKKELKLYSELREALQRNWKKEQADLGIFCKALPGYTPEQYPMAKTPTPEDAPAAPSEQAADEEPEDTDASA